MWLLVGGDSEIGAATFRFLRARGEPVAATTRRPQRVAPERPFLDLALPLGDWAPPSGTRGACIFASVARIASCEANPVGTAHVNVTQTAGLIERLIGHGVGVVFLSTDKVFDGTRPLVPADAPVCPVCEYGRQKSRVEAILRRHMEQGADAAILRLSKVVAPDMPLFAQWVEALSAGRPIRAFRDMTLAPVPAELAGAAISALLGDRTRGVFQLSGPRDVTYSEAGRFLAERLGADPASVVETDASEAGQPRGATARHTTLDSRMMNERYGLAAPDACEVLGSILEHSQQRR